MNILEIVDKREDSSKLTLILKRLRGCNLFKSNIDIICNDFNIERRQLLNYVNRLPYFTIDKSKKFIQLRCKPIKSGDVKWIKSDFESCKGGKEFCFTFFHIMGIEREYNHYVSLNLPFITRAIFHENKKLYRMFYELMN